MENKILKNEVIDIIRGAISEDMDGFGDITSKHLIPPDKNSFSYIVCKEASGAILSGLDVASFVLEEIDSSIKITRLKNDGDRLEYMDRVCNIGGSTLSILKAERTCLNFIQHMSGIATLTGKFAKIAEPYKVKIVDTRKTKPTLRKIEKYAVLCGSGYNHRFGLFDGILIKDKIPDILKYKDSEHLAWGIYYSKTDKDTKERLLLDIACKSNYRSVCEISYRLNLPNVTKTLVEMIKKA